MYHCFHLDEYFIYGWTIANNKTNAKIKKYRDS